MVAVLNERGELVRDGAVTPDGYVVNSIYPSQAPHPPVTDPGKRLPPQTSSTLGDRLSERGISWAWYAGGWNDAVAGEPDPSFQFHHQPYVYFKAYAENTPARAEHLKDEADFLKAIDEGKLPSVSFYKPLGRFNEHPGYTDVLSGDRQAAEIVARIEKSPQWPHVLVIVTYDEFGGYWDHVPPPAGDRWGPGSRIPALIVSPYAKRGYVDHTPYDTTAIVGLIERRFGIKPLGDREAKAGDLSRALDLE